jgi:hypothetical protein
MFSDLLFKVKKKIEKKGKLEITKKKKRNYFGGGGGGTLCFGKFLIKYFKVVHNNCGFVPYEVLCIKKINLHG